MGAALLLLVACSPHGPNLLRPERPVVWPAGSDAPRIELLYAYHGTDHANRARSFWQRVVDFVAGGERRALVSPAGVTTLVDGRVAVADTALGAVHVLDLESGEHEAWGPFPGDLQTTLVGVAASPDGRLFVTDSANGRVLVLSSRGELLGDFGRGELERPTGIVHDAVGARLLVADALAGHIVSFDLRGSVLDVHGRRGTAPGEYNFPVGIAVDARGEVLVVDSLNHRVQALGRDLEPVTQFGIAGTGPGTFARPKGIAADSEGHIYVVDAMFDNVQVFDRQGRLLLAFGENGTALGRLVLPSAIHIDGQDRITVSDAGNSRIQVFQYHRLESRQKR